LGQFYEKCFNPNYFSQHQDYQDKSVELFTLDVLLMIKLKFVLLRSEKQLYSGIPFHIKNLKAVILSKLHSVQQKAQLRPIA